MKRIILLGSSGFIGKHAARQLKKDYPLAEIVELSSQQLDLSKPVNQSTVQSSSGDALIICSGIKRQLGDTFPIFEKNTQMALALVSLITTNEYKKVIYLSSAAVYGEDKNNLTITEDTPVDPRSLYGLSKFSTERLLARACQDKQTSLISLRPPLVYGQGDTSRGYGPAGFYTSISMESALALWGDGSEKREFLYVKDLARILSLSLQLSFSGILNPVSGQSRSYADCSQIMAAEYPQKISIQRKERSKAKVDNIFNATLLYSLLPDFRFTNLEEGLHEMIQEEDIQQETEK